MLAFDLSTCPIPCGFGAGEISRPCGHAMEVVCHADPARGVPPPLYTKYCVINLSIMVVSLCSTVKGTATLMICLWHTIVL